MEEFQGRGSGWRYQSVCHLIVSINKFSPLNRDSGGGTYIPLPTWIYSKSIINDKNNDSRCFLYSILASICKVDLTMNRRIRIESQKYMKFSI